MLFFKPHCLCIPPTLLVLFTNSCYKYQIICAWDFLHTIIDIIGKLSDTFQIRPPNFQSNSLPYCSICPMFIPQYALHCKTGRLEDWYIPQTETSLRLHIYKPFPLAWNYPSSVVHHWHVLLVVSQFISKY